jgi:uncharacterized protein YkwD
MPQQVSRLATFALAATIAVTVFGSAPAPASAADLTVSQAEREVVRLLNVERTKRDLVPLRVDSRLMTIARARSLDMAAKGYFSHTSPTGVDVFDMLNASTVTWYSAGEIIAWNSWPTLALSAQVANSGWMNSTGHRNVILSSSNNYFGVGLAVAASGRKYWTGVFIKGPDRTGAWVRQSAPTVRAGSTATTRQVTFKWNGDDVRLPVLTSGFRSYQVQRRDNDASWVTVWSTTTGTTYSPTVRLGEKLELRVRARDRAGNWGAWRLEKVDL